MDTKTDFMSQKTFDNDLVKIRKSKVTVKLTNQHMLQNVY